MPDIMISYSREDIEFVRWLHERLVIRGYDVWVDWEDIPKTVDWRNEIRAGIESANNFLFVISPFAAESEICAWEVQYAVDHHKRILPVLRRSVDDPDQRAKLHPELNRHNWLFFRDSDNLEHAFDELIRAIETDYDYVRFHTRLLIRAKEWDNAERSRDYLLQGSELIEAERWLKNGQSRRPEPAPLHRQYILSSRQVADAKRRRFRITTLVIAIIVILGLFAGAQSIIANSEREAALLERSRAESARVTAETAEQASRTYSLIANSLLATANGDTDLGIALALAANPTSQLEGFRALAAAAYSPGTRRVLVGHDGPVKAVALSPDATLIASAGRDNTIWLWDITTGEPRHILTGHTGPVWDVTFSADGTQVLSGSSDGTVRLWSVETGAALRTFQILGAALTVAFSPDGDSVIAGSCHEIGLGAQCVQGRQVIFDMETGQVKMLFTGHTGFVSDLAFLDNMVLSASEDNNLILWNTATGKGIARLEGHANVVNTVAIAPNQRLAASGDADGRILLWNLEDGSLSGRLEGHSDSVMDVLFLDNTHLLSASIDGAIRLWDLGLRQAVQVFRGHNAGVTGIAAFPSGFVSSSDDGTLRIWDTQRRDVIHVLAGHREQVSKALFTPDGQTIISASYDGTLKLWDVASGTAAHTLIGHDNWVLDIALSADGKTLLSGSWDGTARLWDVASGRPLTTYDSHNAWIWDVALSPDGRTALSGSRDATMHIWDVRSAETRYILNNQQDADTIEEVGRVAFSPDVQRALSGTFAGNLRLWDTRSGELVYDIDAHSTWVQAMQFSPDGRYFLSAASNELYLWDTTTGRRVHELNGHTDFITAIEFSPDGKTAATASADTTIRLWDVESGTLLRTFSGHAGIVWAIAFSPDGTRLLSGSGDHTVRLWDVATGTEIHQYSGHSDAVNSVSFNPDGTMALSASVDATVRLWRVDTIESLIAFTRENRYVRELTCEERARFQVAPLCALGQ